MIQHIITGLCDLVFPRNCFICHNQIPTQNSQEGVCPDCLRCMRMNFPPFCQKCNRHLQGPYVAALCHNCRTYKPHFDFAWGACLYTAHLKKMIHSFKYGQKTMLRHTLANLMISHVKKYSLDIQQFDLLIPIPLHPTRQRERGYNQAFCLAQGLSKYYKIPLKPNILKRVEHTKNQTSLSRKDRWTNLTSAFKMSTPSNVNNKSILLIDDLLTTGATSSQAAQTLKEAGANTVGVLTLAIR